MDIRPGRPALADPPQLLFNKIRDAKGPSRCGEEKRKPEAAATGLAAAKQRLARAERAPGRKLKEPSSWETERRTSCALLVSVILAPGTTAIGSWNIVTVSE
jgi:hypothetical protein